MKREELLAMGLPKEAIDKIMAQNGKDIERHKLEAQEAAARVRELEQELMAREAAGAETPDLDALRQELEALRLAYDEERAEWARREAALEFEERCRQFFAGVEFSDEFSKRGVLEAFYEQAFPYEDGRFVGAEEWLGEVKAKAPTAFATEAGMVPCVVQSTGAENLSLSREAFGKMGYRERLMLKKSNPSLYKQVKE